MYAVAYYISEWDLSFRNSFISLVRVVSRGFRWGDALLDQGLILTWEKDDSLYSSY